MAESFVHLHNHSEFSMLDGAARVKDMFTQAEKLGMTSLAITDHGNLFGAYEFYKASKNYAVKPIIGLEAYLTPARTAPSASGSSSATAPGTTWPPRAPTPT